MRCLLLISVYFLGMGCSRSVEENDDLLINLMKQKTEQFNSFLEQKDSLEIQIIYTMIDRDAQNRPSFRSFYFNADPSHYFYPASTVKLPLCLLALEKLNDLNVSGLDAQTPMFHDSVYSGQISVTADTTAENRLPSIAHYMRKILVVSDNDAYNRLYEWVGQRAVHERLHALGYNTRIVHRLERPLTPDQNRHTEAIRFVKDGQVIHQQPMLVNPDSIEAPAFVQKGKGYYKADTLLMTTPFDFTYKNFYSLHDQQQLLRTLLFPESVPQAKRFRLTPDQYRFVYQYMSQLPSETSYPPYYQDDYFYDAYCKFFMFGEDRQPIPENIRIFNKVGDAYGYLIDNAYIVDFENNIEFMVSAVINTNTDGIYNDGKYEYQALGYPFFKNLGNLLYQYELERKRKHAPDLSAFRMTYDRDRGDGKKSKVQ
jgi:hypothetical protein